jgi:hypothetical protein
MAVEQGVQALYTVIRVSGVASGVVIFFASMSVINAQPAIGGAGLILALATSWVPSWIIDKFNE